MRIKKVVKIIAVAGVLALLAFNGYWFLWKEMREDAFQKGFQSAQIQINNAILQQLNDTGQLRINIPQEDGTMGVIILMPKQ